MAALGWLLNLDFAASTVAEAPAPAAQPKTGGGRGAKARRRTRYPRRVSIGGELHWVRNAEEERALLAAYLREVEAEALELALQEAPAEEVRKARVRVVKVARRIEKVENREADWLDELRREDEDIVAILYH